MLLSSERSALNDAAHIEINVVRAGFSKADFKQNRAFLAL
jgi:hypothetical protein